MSESAGAYTVAARQPGRRASSAAFGRSTRRTTATPEPLTVAPAVPFGLDRVPVHPAGPPPTSSQAGSAAVLQRCADHACPSGGCGHEDEAEVHRQADSARDGPATESVPAEVLDVVRSPGPPLALATRRFLEPRFGHDLGHVRVHTGAAAGRAARAVAARAYTIGRDVVFGDGQYDPDGPAGQRLIAHEMAHVVQQRTGRQTLNRQPLTVSSPSDPAEAQADRAADEAMGAGPGSKTAAPGQQRQAPAGAACTSVTGGSIPAGLTVANFVRSSYNVPKVGDRPLKALADRLNSGDGKGVVQVHGFASEEGNKDYNAWLSCSRAAATMKVLRDTYHVRNPITMIGHGPTTALGPRREDNRAVIVTEPTASSTQPATDQPVTTQTTTGPRNAGPQDAGPRDAGPQDAGPQDAGPQDAGPRDAGPQDAGEQAAGGQVSLQAGTGGVGHIYTTPAGPNPALYEFLLQAQLAYTYQFHPENKSGKELQVLAQAQYSVSTGQFTLGGGVQGSRVYALPHHLQLSFWGQLMGAKNVTSGAGQLQLTVGAQITWQPRDVKWLQLGAQVGAGPTVQFPGPSSVDISPVIFITIHN
jgi:outer membrane protein OmpA-like peptidoglycan-associated protein